MAAVNLRDHITATYFNLRVGLASVALILPVILWAGGDLSGVPLQASMSAYYHANDGVMRDEFVGILIAIGSFLYLYKGFTHAENFALNVAGIFLVGVALAPMQWDCANACDKFSLHGTFAVLFFVAIAYVCWFCASDTLDLIEDQAVVTFYKNLYRLEAAGLFLSPVGAFVFEWLLAASSEGNHRVSAAEGDYWVFAAEALGIAAFVAYWITKSIELKVHHTEDDAIDGKLEMRQLGIMSYKLEPAEKAGAVD